MSETTSSIVFYFSLICALAGLATLPFGWLADVGTEFVMLVMIGVLGGHVPSAADRELSPTRRRRWWRRSTIRRCCGRFCSAISLFGELPSIFVFVGAVIVVACGLFVIWRERQLGADEVKASAFEGSPVDRAGQNALKQIIVWVSWMPGIICTFSLTKWPMSVACST